MDRTLFDFDDEIDKLSDVSERYKLLMQQQHINTIGEKIIAPNTKIMNPQPEFRMSKSLERKTIISKPLIKTLRKPNLEK